MALPVIPRPIFRVRNEWLPKGGIEMYPYGTGQESILMLAKDGNTSSMYTAIKQIIQECCKTEGIDVGTLPTFVAEDLVLQLNRHSSTEKFSFSHKCEEMHDGNPCHCTLPLSIKITDMTIKKQDGFRDTFQITEDIGIKMRFPTLDDFFESVIEKTGEDGKVTEVIDEKAVIIKCIDLITLGEQVFRPADETEEERVKFYNSIPPLEKMTIVADFFNRLPRVYHEIRTECPKCKAEKYFVFEGIDSVFQ